MGLDLADSLIEAGYRAILFRTCEEALDYLAINRPDLAVLDVRLTDGECDAAAKKLVEQGVPFIVYSGMLDDSHDPIFNSGTLLSKPATSSDILDLAGSLLAQA
ncbi:histidine kinase [Mesorhizobium loti]|uniref:histidine kinase n=1 Tax=Rhizobium loti TaxID=381 RepID=UPI00041E6EC0|nr:histidine kinase [Mesorhizobium loti]